jgi:hypothetical protein
MLADVRAMRWNYWRYVLDASVHTAPFKWVWTRAARRRICDAYDVWLTR